MAINAHINRRLGPVLVLLLFTLAIVATAAVLRGAEDKEASSSRAQPANENDLSRLIDNTIDSSEFATARWGVYVVALNDGHVVYSRNADKLFTPASNMKVYTTAVALDLLGADYRWRTSVYADKQVNASGIIEGDLTLYGRGAPDLTSRPHQDSPGSLQQLADDLYQRGVRRVHGNVVGDESYFRGEPLGDGWLWNDVQWYFGAEPSALSIDGNEVDVEIKPAEKGAGPPVAKLSREESELQITSDIATVKAGERLKVGIHRGLSDNNIRVWGEFPEGSRGFGARLSVHNPARLAASLFLAALKTRGIAVDGEARTRDFRVPPKQRFDPASAVELASISSRTLAEIVKFTNKESINLYAELILRTLGRERRPLVEGSEDKSRERGDDEIGVAVVRLWLERAGIKTKGLALHDGSGLSRLDLVTPETTVGLLRAIMKTNSAASFRDSLPQAGKDGTLGGRLRAYKDRVVAKTGSLTYDNSLSGYLLVPEGSDLAFSIMANDETGPGSSIKLIDQIVGTIADYSSSKTPNPQKSP
jgi:D-alanyl-D-alanine carboxypeptidase/D-alanyl-D-alanine-endopeptidase (penicillin-binding protein 4)